jgi:predicted nuclease with TOPRIM domain
MSSLVQMGASISTAQLSESDGKVNALQERLDSKKQQMMQLAESFGKMHSSLSDIKQRFTDAKRGSLVELNELMTAKEDSKLSELRAKSVVGQRLGEMRFSK